MTMHYQTWWGKDKQEVIEKIKKHPWWGTKYEIVRIKLEKKGKNKNKYSVVLRWKYRKNRRRFRR